MKKIISLFAALAMVSTIFASVAFAEIPASATLHLDIKEADAEQIDIYENNVDEVPTGYTLYVVKVSQSGLGNFTNTNSQTSNVQKKKPVGFLPINMTFKWTFDETNFGNIYPDGDYIYAKGNEFAFKTSYSDTARSISAYIDTITNGTDPYPLNAAGTASIAENVSLVDLYIPVNATTQGTLDESSLFNMAQMSAGSNQEISGANVTSNQAKYSIQNGYLTCSDSLVLGAAPATKYTIAFKDYDGSNLQSNEYNENDTVTAPTATRSGYTFSHWSETPGGAAATVLTTATADKTYYAVYTKDPVITDSSIDVKKPISGTIGLTDLQGKDVTLTANYGIAKFSKAIDTVANKYFVVATDSNDVEKEFEVDFAANGVEISNASTTFFAIVKSADHIIKSIRLKEIAK